jgi:RimJ/RimL family protein N-acetyltransferase
MTLHLLDPKQYPAVQPLFNGRSLPLYCQGVLTGKYPGKVIADEVDHPHSALLIKDSWCHLLGDPSNAPFNAALRLAFAGKEYIGEGTRVLFFIEPAPAWCAVLNELVENRQPIATTRCLYVATQAYRPPTPAPAEGFELRFIDESVPRLVDGELPDDVQKVLQLRRPAAHPDERAFGYVALHGRTCAAWAVIDFIVGDIGEIRLVTAEPYRRCGLACATSAAAITYGFAHGLNEIHWDAAASNLPSIRTAEKLGLHLHHQLTEYVLIFPEAGYLINLAWNHLDNGRFDQTLAVAGQMIPSDKAILVQYGHFLAGAASAGLGNPNEALDHLTKAIAAGFDDLSAIENCPPLTILHGSPEWQHMIARIQV